VKNEPGLIDWKVFVDANYNDFADEGEISTQTLDGPLNPGVLDGVYWLRKVPTGMVRVCVVPQGNWLSTFPEQANCREINLSPLTIKTGVNFGYLEVQSGTLSIDVITTPSGATEIFEFELRQQDAVLQTAALADLDEPVSFTLDPGEYQLTQNLPENSTLYPYKATCLVDGVSTDPETITLNAGESVECVFDNRQSGKIRVFSFHDLDRDAMQAANEPGLVGWEFAVYRGGECNVAENLVTQGVTDEFGYVVLAGVFPDELNPVEYSVYPATLFDGNHDNWFETSGGNCRSLSIEDFSSEKNLIFGIAEQP